MRKYVIFSIAIFLLLFFAIIYGCGPSKPEPVKVGGIPDTEFDPEEWGKVYPLHYESWMKTKNTKPNNKSKYRRGWDDDEITYDKLSEYPYSALLYNGWGFGIEYNEPRGHFYAVIDQLIIDPSRVKPGGVCLACKSPFHKSFTEKMGMNYLTAKFNDAVNMIPEKLRKLGPACYDCHKPSTMELRTNKPHLTRGLEMIGKDDVSHQEARILACAQCHITYYVPRDKDKKVAGDVNLPWTGGSWGNISIENIIKDLLTDFQRIEWKQAVTGFYMPFIRHPEFELFTKGSTHFNAGLSCADCHMPYKRVGSYKISDHDVTSPLKTDLKVCAQCHTESATWLKQQVALIQDRTASLQLRAGYGAAVTAKLFELANDAQTNGTPIDQNLYASAKNHYMEAFLRLTFINAENSTGFHNPSETGRILGDSIAFSGKAEGLLRQLLSKAGIPVFESISLELGKYLNNRGVKPHIFKPEQEILDPFDIQKYFVPRQTMGI
jgi:nitrite reductase (cytochrome c-552)